MACHTDHPLHISNIRKMSLAQQKEFYEGLTPQQAIEYKHHWPYHARKGQVLPEEGWSEALLLCGRGWGKLASIKTPIITPSGMVTLGDIKVGDKVIDENGQECNVLAVHDNKKEDSLKYYRLGFSDGSFINCCSEHQWTTWTRSDRRSYSRSNNYNEKPKPTLLPENWPNWKRNRKKIGSQKNIGPSVKTTQEIIDTFKSTKHINHSIPVCKPVDLEEKELTVNP